MNPTIKRILIGALALVLLPLTLALVCMWIIGDIYYYFIDG